jgi:hypothetical protein
MVSMQSRTFSIKPPGKMATVNGKFCKFSTFPRKPKHGEKSQLLLLFCPALASFPSLGSDTTIFLFLGTITPFFLYNFLFASLDTSTLKMETVGSTEMLVNASNTTQCINPKDQHLNLP